MLNPQFILSIAEELVVDLCADSRKLHRVASTDGCNITNSSQCSRALCWRSAHLDDLAFLFIQVLKQSHLGFLEQPQREGRRRTDWMHLTRQRFIIHTRVSRQFKGHHRMPNMITPPRNRYRDTPIHGRYVKDLGLVWKSNRSQQPKSDLTDLPAITRLKFRQGLCYRAKASNDWPHAQQRGGSGQHCSIKLTFSSFPHSMSMLEKRDTNCNTQRNQRSKSLHPRGTVTDVQVRHKQACISSEFHSFSPFDTGELQITLSDCRRVSGTRPST